MRYDIREVEGFNNARVFQVTPTRAIGGPGDAVQVWFSRGTARCTECSTPLRGMSASCAHAAAVKRHLKGEIADAALGVERYGWTPDGMLSHPQHQGVTIGEYVRSRDYAALLAEVAELRANDARYRWLRLNAFTVTVPAIDFAWVAELDEHAPDYSLDRAIDAAIEASTMGRAKD